MKQWIRRGAALGLALALTVTAASASQAMGWDVHTGRAPLSQGASLGKNVFWSDTYSDLRTEYYVEYSPNASVVPTVAYGSKVTDRVTLSGMAQTLESQGKRVVSGLNGDWYVLSTGAPTGLVVTDGIVRATGYYNDTWAIGFNADGTAFIARNGLSVSVSFGGQAVKLGGGINKVRKLTDSAAVGGLTLLTDDFAATTQNTEPGVDVILSPVDDGTGTYAVKPTIGRQTQYVVEQVLESTGSIPIPEGKAVLTLNAKESEEALARLRALQPGDTVTLTVSSSDQRWSQAVQALGGVSKLVTNGQVDSGLDASRTAWPAIGIKADGTVIFYAMDGKQPGYSVGATQGQVAQRLIELGCVEAICMDGGGSTTIGVTYPDQEGMQVVNKPSDGSQRKNSTAIFLTTGLQPTGELASYYVTPSDSILLSGATVQLSATGLDTSYFPTSGGGVSWSVSSGGGTVDENGLFTAGAESGFAQVTATDGSASGTGYITTVRTPDEITLTNEATGAAVASLNLDPGGQVDLKASASYRKLALTAQDTCFTWSADPEVGTVDANGVFTAGTKSASGNLTVSAGGKTLTVPVSIAGHVKTLEDCEGDLASFGATSTASYGAETGLDYVHNGRQSLRMTYDASTGGTASLNSAQPIPAGESWLGGVVGLGEDLLDCRAMVRAQGDGEYWGAIAGQAEGDLAGNRYLMEDLAGLDGVDYAERAQGLDFDSFRQLNYLPEDFLTFSYRFTVNGSLLAEVPFSYGGDLDPEQIPAPPEQNGQYGQWPFFPTKDLRRSMVLEAEFEDPTSTLSSGEDIPTLLAQGIFSPDAKLTIRAQSVEEDTVEGCASVGAWTYSVTGSKEDTVTLRLRTEGAEHPDAALYQDGRWSRVEGELDGSYLVFQAPVQGQVMLLDQRALPVLAVALCGGGVLALLLALFLIRRRRQRKSLAAAPQSEDLSQPVG